MLSEVPFECLKSIKGESEIEPRVVFVVIHENLKCQ